MASPLWPLPLESARHTAQCRRKLETREASADERAFLTTCEIALFDPRRGTLLLVPVRFLECVFGSLLMIDKRFSGAEAVNEIQLSQCFKTGLRQGAL